jgi:hypothetical protein
VNFKIEGKAVFSIPRTTRARATDTPQVARPVTLTPWQGTRHLWQAKRAPFRLRHDDRLKKGVPHCLNLYHVFLFPLSLLPQGSGKGIFRKDPSQRRKRASIPLLIRGSKVAPCGVRQPPRSTRAPSPLLIRGSKVAPCGVRKLPQSTRAPSPLLIRGSKAGPSEGFDSRPEHGESGMTLGTSVTWPRLGLRSPGTLRHFRDQWEQFVMESHRREAPIPRTLSNGSGSSESPTGTFGTCLRATSRPLSNGARASAQITR